MQSQIPMMRALSLRVQRVGGCLPHQLGERGRVLHDGERSRQAVGDSCTQDRVRRRVQ